MKRLHQMDEIRESENEKYKSALSVGHKNMILCVSIWIFWSFRTTYFFSRSIKNLGKNIE